MSLIKKADLKNYFSNKSTSGVLSFKPAPGQANHQESGSTPAQNPMTDRFKTPGQKSSS